MTKKTKKIYRKINKASVAIKKEANAVKRKIENIVIMQKQKPVFIQLSLGRNVINRGFEKINYQAAKSYDAIVRDMQSQLANEFKVKLTKKDLQIIASKKSLILSEVKINSNRFRNDLKKMLLQNMGKGLDTFQIVESLKVLYPNMAQHTYTIVNTGMQRMYKDGKFTKTSGLYQKFRYAGPADEANRPFCSEHVGNIYDKAEAERLQGNIMGFYNCRHELDPVRGSSTTIGK